jgi:cobalamin biosynthesis protein CobD/CbiB
MGLILTATAGLMIWIVLWALDISGFDAILIAVIMVLTALAVRQVLPHLPGRRD